MEGPVIPVSMPMFSFGSDFKNVYKTIKNSNSSVEEDDGAANNISQQYSNHGNFNRWIDTDSRHSDISSAAFGFLNKPKEISLAVMSNFRVYTCGNKFKEYYFNTCRGEEKENCRTVPISIE